MDENNLRSLPFTEIERVECQKKIAEKISIMYKTKQIGFSDMKGSANFSLEYLPMVQTKGDLIMFFEAICVRYPFFNDMLIISKNIFVQNQEEIEINNIIERMRAMAI